ncbi:MAG: hypothetical protein PHF97_01790 [Bacteroidales bacterium]|nr:hypothetical protein [Bacteroidales bacterium]
MDSKGLRAISCQVTQKIEAGCNPSHTTETIINDTRAFLIYYLTFPRNWLAKSRGTSIKAPLIFPY